MLWKTEAHPQALLNRLTQIFTKIGSTFHELLHAKNIMKLAEALCRN
jgi:hypothetical protein